MANDFLGITLTQWLGLSVAAAVITTVGSLAATVVKDFFFTRSFEKWRRRQDRLAVYERFRDPLAASAIELANRLHELVGQHPASYLERHVFDLRPARQLGNDASDPYFKHYKLVSTLYRFACFFGWLELYRQETTFLRIGDERRTLALQKALTAIRSDIADGHVNMHTDWADWHDALIFREELRAIGEVMIEGSGQLRSIIGYGKFRDCVESDERNEIHRLCDTILNFIGDPRDDGRDFRHERIVRLLVHLVDLIELLNPSGVNVRLHEARDAGTKLVTAWPT